MAEAHEQTLAHLRLLAGLPGYWELRALHRNGPNPMTPRGSFWIVATATTNGLLYERLDQALVCEIYPAFRVGSGLSVWSQELR